MVYKTYPVEMEIAGNTAMWTRPDCGDSPCSYPAPTYSSVRGLFESILWGPAVLIIPRKVELCSVPQYHSYVVDPCARVIPSKRAITISFTQRC